MSQLTVTVPLLPDQYAGGNVLSWSPVKVIMPVASCFMLFMHWARFAALLALDNTGRSIAAKIAMMAMTTRSSIRVKPLTV